VAGRAVAVGVELREVLAELRVAELEAELVDHHRELGLR
jgi:hypothetical protein